MYHVIVIIILIIFPKQWLKITVNQTDFAVVTDEVLYTTHTMTKVSDFHAWRSFSNCTFSSCGKAWMEERRWRQELDTLSAQWTHCVDIET